MYDRTTTALFDHPVRAVAGALSGLVLAAGLVAAATGAAHAEEAHGATAFAHVRAEAVAPDAMKSTLVTTTAPAPLPAARSALVLDGDPTWDLPNLDHPRVDEFVDMFQGRKRDEFSKYLARSGTYVPMISEKLAERDMPQDLIYLAMIESGFDPKAYSPAHASGIWQFIAETGTRYGLDVNRAVDERRDPERATEAALSYLQDLHDRFGSWYLAAAAYNTGENRVGRIMREVTGSERGNEYSYYEIRDRLPKETRDYVPLMVAAARIAKEPHKYGFETIRLEAPHRYEVVEVPPATPLDALAQATGATVTIIKELNPQLVLDRTRNDVPAPVRVPEGTARAVAAALGR